MVSLNEIKAKVEYYGEKKIIGKRSLTIGEFIALILGVIVLYYGWKKKDVRLIALSQAIILGGMIAF